MHCFKSLLIILVTTQNVAIMWKQDFSEIIPRAKAPQKTCSLLGLNTCIPTIPILITVALCLCLQFCPYSVYEKQARALLVCFFGTSRVTLCSHYRRKHSIPGFYSKCQLRRKEGLEAPTVQQRCTTRAQLQSLSAIFYVTSSKTEVHLF